MIDENIILYLEEIDTTFSKINRITRDIKSKLEIINSNNKETVQNLKPWIKFFDLENKQILENKNLNSTNNIILTTNNNPVKKTEIKFNFEKNTSNKNHTNLFIDTDMRYKDITSEDVLDELPSNDSEDSELISFDINLLPCVFQNENEIVRIYEYIKNGAGIQVDIVYSFLGVEWKDKVKIFVELLVKKKFVRMRNGILSV